MSEAIALPRTTSQLATVSTGEHTLDKFRIPALFETHVPDFPGKEACARVIHDCVRGNDVVPESVDAYLNLVVACEAALPD